MKSVVKSLNDIIIIMSAKELSALTGHGVDDCKTVLAECGGDVERAVDALLNSA